MVLAKSKLSFSSFSVYPIKIPLGKRLSNPVVTTLE